MQRIAVIEEALIRVLDRDDSVEVEPASGGDPACLYVIDPDALFRTTSNPRRGHSLYQLARELELLL